MGGAWTSSCSFDWRIFCLELHGPRPYDRGGSSLGVGGSFLCESDSEAPVEAGCLEASRCFGLCASTVSFAAAAFSSLRGESLACRSASHNVAPAKRITYQ